MRQQTAPSGSVSVTSKRAMPPVAALRRHLRLGSGFEPIEDETEEAALAGFLRAAIATVEARTGKVLLTRVFRLRLEDWRDPAGQPLPPQPSANEISPEALASVREVEKRARKLTLMELTERTCKWPIGDPSSREFSFCGRRSSEGVYCVEHARVAYQPQVRKSAGKDASSDLARSLRRYI